MQVATLLAAVALALAAPSCAGLRPPVRPHRSVVTTSRLGSGVVGRRTVSPRAQRAQPRALMPLPDMALAEEVSGSTYSALSYYGTLGLFILSFPGIISQVTRSTKAKIKRKVYELPGPATSDGKPIKQVAGEVVAHFQANNYKIKSAGETIVFEGLVAGTRGQASFLTFLVFGSLASLSLVLSILEKQAFGDGGFQLGNFWYASTLLSPLAGKYYLDNAERNDEVSVKLVISDDEKTIDLTVQGDEPELERLQEGLGLMQKGMEYVPGLLQPKE